MQIPTSNTSIVSLTPTLMARELSHLPFKRLKELEGGLGSLSVRSSESTQGSELENLMKNNVMESPISSMILKVMESPDGSSTD